MSNASRLKLAKLLWGWEPHDSQKTWLLCDAKVKVAACGRRWGKTEAAAVDAALMAICCPGCSQMIVSPSYDQSRLIFDTVERLIMGSNILRPLSKVVRTPYPWLRIGQSIISARTADDDGRNLRGHSADRVIVDEAAYVRDSVISEVIAPMLADRDGRLVMISTPLGKNHFYRAFVKGQEAGNGRYASFSFPSVANPHISSDYIEEQRKAISERQFAVEYEARFCDDQSSVFKWEDIQAASEKPCVLGDFDFVVAGIDWARYSDYTALVAIAVRDGEMVCVGLDHFNGLAWQAQIERVVRFLKAHHASIALADQTSIGDPLIEQLRQALCDEGVNVDVRGYGFTNNSKREIVDNLALLFAHGQLAIPNDERLLRELQFFEYEVTGAGNLRFNARNGFHDDLVIALALACKQAKEAGGEGNYLAAGGRASSDVW